MAKHADVAIVGGGIIGLTCAYFLAKEGLSVEVFERGELGKEASWAGAGILPPGNPAGAATPIDQLRAIGRCAFPASREELRELTGIDNGYIRSGGIEFLSEDDQDAPRTLGERGYRVRAVVEGLALGVYEPAIEDAARRNPIFSPAALRSATRGT